MNGSPAAASGLTEDRAQLLARLLRERGLAAAQPPPRIPRRSGDGPWRLSFSQERLWFLDQLDPGGTAYNIPMAGRLRGPLDRVALASALALVVERHESLRTTIATVDAEPRQVVHPAARPPLPLVDVTALPAPRRDRELARLAAVEAGGSFDLARGPLLRMRLVRLAADEHGVLLTLHHIVGDGWSVGVLLRELAIAYAGCRAGLAPALPRLPVQYADFAEWQREHFSGQALDAELEHWRERLDGLPPVLELPTDRPRPTFPSQRGASRPASLPAALRGQLAAHARETGTTLFVVLLAGWQCLLARLCGQLDFAVGSPVAGRRRAETEGLIGFFVNTLVLRSDLQGDDGFRAIVGRVQQRVVDAQAHQDLPLEKLVAELRPDRSLAHNALFQVMFSLEAADAEADRDHAGFDGLDFEPLSAAGTTAKVDVTLVFRDHGDRLGGWIEYSTDLFDATTVARFLGHLSTLLAAAVAAPDLALSRLPLLSRSEAQQLLVECADTGTSYPRRRTIADLFAERAAAVPDAVAVVDGPLCLSYRELASRSATVAAALRRAGATIESPVGVCMERSAALVTALAGVVAAGGAYVPLDPEYPAQRLAFMLADAGVALLLADEAGRRALPKLDDAVRLIPIEEALAGGGPGPPPCPGLEPDHLAYVIYTSGSTGRPKGVAVTHRGVARLVLDTDYVSLAPGDRMAQASTASFDAATFEIWGALLTGGRLVLVPRDASLDPERLRDLLAREGVDVLFLTTALFQQAADAVPDAFAPLREVLFGGEAVDPGRVRRVCESGAPRRLLHVYGPTESTTYASWHPVREVPPAAPTVPIGRPLANTVLHVVDRHLAPVPLGVAGELLIGGDGLARGYLRRPGLTAERFVPDPHGEAGGRLYRTGDLVRRRGDGAVEFLGRRDHQIKLRGFRIELGEIETALLAHPRVRQAVVTVHGSGDERALAAYVVATAPAPGTAELREHLRQRVPAFMVPTSVAHLDELPLNAHGKIDRSALPAPPATANDSGVVYRPPRTAAEARLADVWAEVLGVEQVGIDDDFFVLGGHSLLATRLISRVRAAFEVELPLRRLFEAPTVAELAPLVEAARGPGAARPPLTPRPAETAELPLSFAQQRLWFLDQLEEGSPRYNLPVALRIAGPLEPVLLERALEEIERRHEALRTVFATTDGAPVQVVLPPRALRLPRVDLSALPPERIEEELRRTAAEEARRPFALDRGPLWRSRLLQLGPGDHAVLVTLHHIAGDGWSLRLMVREVAELYSAYRRGGSSPLAPLPVQYADFALWQRSWLVGEVVESEVEHWRRRLAGAPPFLDLPTDRPRRAVQSLAGAVAPVRLPAELVAALREVARRQGATVYMVLLAGFHALLSRDADQTDVCVGTPISGRDRLEIEGLVGFFVNTLVVRASLGGGPGFEELVTLVREAALDAQEHQELPFERLVEALAPQRSLAHTPLFQVMFDLVHRAEPLVAPAELDLRPLSPDLGVAKFDLTLALEEAGDEVVGSLEYATALFDATTAVRMVDRYRRLLTAAVGGPRRPVAELETISVAERHQVLTEWPRSLAAPPPARLEALVARQASARPDAVALVSAGGAAITYGTLARRAGDLAERLAACGVGPEVVVGLELERGPELVIAYLGILEAGGVCLPLDPRQPAERRGWVLADAGAAVVVAAAADGVAAPLPLSHETVRSAAASLRPSSRGTGDAAYLLYTSGSTGTPKGVVVEHAAAAGYAEAAVEHYDLGPADRALQMAAPTFDLSFEEIFPCLVAGGAVVFADDSARLSPRLMVERCREERVTFLSLATAYWHELARVLSAGEAELPRSLRRTSIGGEKVDAARVAEWCSRASTGELVNSYGPTEATVVATVHRVAAAPAGGREVPLGRPVRGVEALVLDRRLQPVAVGVPGELCLAGAGLARGYRGRPGATASAFVPHPYEAGGRRLYRTGDRARWRSDGRLEYLGRFDRQVKVRGFRVEPGEVEARLAEHPGVAAAAVLALASAAGDLRLVAFAAVEPGGPPRGELLDALRRSLPDHLVPAEMVVLDELPRTAHGKVDRHALAGKAPVEAVVAGGTGSTARDSVEGVVLEVFRELLGRGDLAPEGDFFAAGGHSLLATRVISRLRHAFRVELPLRELFERPTARGIAGRVRTALAADAGLLLPDLVPVERGGDLPLSYAQQRLWIIDRLEPGSALYNMPLGLHVRGPLDRGLLSRALDVVADRHEVLRTGFTSRDELPVQVVRPPAPVPLPLVDLSLLPEPARWRRARALAAAEARQPFDLERGPVWRVTLLRLDQAEHVVLVTLHHIAGDGWSLGILVREVTELYDALRSGRRPELAALPVQYADYAAWQRGWLDGELLAREIDFWRRRLEGAAPLLELPTDRARPLAARHRGAVHVHRVGVDLASGLIALGRRRGATLFMTLLAAFGEQLSRYCGRRDVVVGTPVAGRTRFEVEGLVGFFINMLVLRADLGGAPAFGELVERVRDVALEAHAHQDVPFEKLVEELAPQRSLAHTPLFQVMFVVQNAPEEEVVLADLEVRPWGGAGVMAKYDLALSVEETPEGLLAAWQYDADLFDEATIVRWAGHLDVLLSAAVGDPAAPAERLPLLAEAERRQLAAWAVGADGLGGVPGEEHLSLPERFARRAAAIPDAIAVVGTDSTVSYGELARRAAHLAARLVRRGAGAETRVAVCLERSAELVVALLGVLRAGAAYVPLDPSYPDERLISLLADCGAALLVADPATGARLTASGVPVVAPSAGGRGDAPPPVSAPEPEHAAYVIYTSGSTGRPKGVVVEHRQLASYLSAVLDRVAMPPGTSFAILSTIAADLGSTMVFAAMATGGTLHVVLRETAADAQALATYFTEHAVDCAKLVPSHLAALLAAAPGAAVLPRRLLILAGEKLPLGLLETVWREAPGLRVMNHYGPTETTVAVLTWEARVEGSPPPVGRPLAGSRAWVLDPAGGAAPIGVPGDLFVGGANVSRGYLGRPAATAERFLPDPQGERPGDRLYRTGDLVRWRADGELEVLGRRDQQIKVRGFRVEPGEVEAALRELAEVSAAVVGLAAGAAGERLVAWVVPAAGCAIDPASLASELARRLPDPMVPRAFVVLDALPLNANGKLDRFALPPPSADGGASPDRWLPPGTPAEEIVAAIWSELLGTPRVGRDDSFFALGGHSLLAIRVLARVRAAFDRELPLRDLFEEPTLAGFAARVIAADDASVAPAPPLSRRPPGGEAPLSFSQQRLWFLDRLDPGGSAYNVPLALEVEGSLRPEVLTAALGEVVRRHEVLRTVFAERDGEPFQEVRPAAPAALARVDLSALPARTGAAEARRLAAEEARRSFDLAAGPLIRGLLVTLAADRHRVLVTLHHIVSDGWSRGILIAETAALYTAIAAGRRSPLRELPIQYADYAAWQRGWLAGDTLAQEVEFWRDRLAGAPPLLELPTDRPRPAVQRSSAGLVEVALPPAVGAPLAALVRQLGATPFMALMAGFQALLSRLSGQRDLCVGTPVAGRGRLETEPLIGFFVNTLVLRADLSEEPGFAELVRRTRSDALEVHAHQDVPFEKLVEELAPQRSLAHSPLFQSLFVLQNVPAAEAEIEGLRFRPVDAGAPAAKFDLTLGLAEADDGGFRGAFEYRSDLFDRVTIERLARQLGRLLASAVASPDVPVSELALLDAAEEQQVLREWGSGAGAGAVEPVHEAVVRCAAAAPDAVAVVRGGEHLSYGELERRSRRLAAGLAGFGAGRGRVVGVYRRRVPEAIVEQLAVLRWGAAYLPLDPAQPPARAAELLTDAGAVALLAADELAARLPGEPPPRPTRPAADAPAPAAASDLSDPAYVVYTSGSTGRPKGVVVPHRGFANLVSWHRHAFAVTAAARASHVAGLGFDAAVCEVWPYLAAGAQVHLLSSPAGLEPAALDAWWSEAEITHAFLPTPVAEAWLGEAERDGGARGAASLSWLLTGGDRLRRASPAARGFRFFNLYGPTETSVVVVAAEVEPGPGGGPPPIGRPIDGTVARVVDGGMRPVPPGVAGELVLGGVGLAHGYLGRPALTAERFVPDPFTFAPGERLYRSGDRVRWLPGGRLEFLGRLDRQVQLRGLRIEPGEVEAALRAAPGVAEAAVGLRSAPTGDRLVAWWVPAAGAEVGPEELRARLAHRLPEYMVPAAFVAMASLPLTANGKIDVAGLPDPAEDTDAGPVAPRDRLEAELTTLWEELLGRPLGVRDDFFALGGHSLLATRLMARVRRRFDHDLPLAALFAAPTVEGMAALLRRGASLSAGPLVALRSDGEGRPLFCVHPVGGEVFCYLELARALGPERPFYAIQAAADGPGRIEEMAEAYLAAVRDVQPHGPYLLAGWSLGGVVAFEMARRLEAAGDAVERLFLFDAFAPQQAAAGEEAGEADLLALFARDLFGVAGAELPELPVTSAADEDTLRGLFAAAQERSLLPPDVDFTAVSRAWGIFRRHVRALEAYAGGPWSGPAAVFRAEDARRSEPGDGALGWTGFVRGPLTVHPLPGDHYSLLRRPHVDTLASRLRTLLDDRPPDGSSAGQPKEGPR